MNGKRMTILDVARETGVYYSTVSRALRNDRRIPEPTRLRIRLAARRLGYVPNRVARSLAHGATHTIGIMLTDMQSYFVAPVDEFQNFSDRSNYTLSVHFCSWDQRRERKGLQHFAEGRVEGVIWAPVQWEGPEFVQSIADLQAARIPVVMLGLQRDQQSVPFHQVGAKPADKLALGLDYLLGRGHRRIGIATATNLNGQRGRLHVERLALLRGLFEARGLPLLADDIFNVVDEDYGGFDIAAELSRRAPPRPTAIFALDDFLARGLMKGLRVLGLKAPEEISVLGFDVVGDEAAGRWPLTSVWLESRRMGELAVKQLFKIIRREAANTPPQTIIVPPRIVEGGSVGKNETNSLFLKESHDTDPAKTSS